MTKHFWPLYVYFIEVRQTACYFGCLSIIHSIIHKVLNFEIHNGFNFSNKTDTNISIEFLFLEILNPMKHQVGKTNYNPTQMCHIQCSAQHGVL